MSMLWKGLQLHLLSKMQGKWGRGSGQHVETQLCCRAQEDFDDLLRLTVASSLQVQRGRPAVQYSDPL